MFVYIVYIQLNLNIYPPHFLNLYFLLEPNVLDVWYFARVLTSNTL